MKRIKNKEKNKNGRILKNKRWKQNRKNKGKPRNPHGCIYIYIYIVYCHLENKKTNLEVTGYKFEYNFVKFNNKIKDRTILKVDMDKNIKNILKSSYFISIGLSFCAFHYKGKRAGPKKVYS